jgi:hypothetical protein
VSVVTKLPANFRHIRLLLAREKDHPSGSREEGYDLLAPLDEESRIDAHEWKRHPENCRVRHFHPAKEDRIGRLRRKPGGQWYFDYASGEDNVETGFHFGEERFTAGEYVSIKSGNAMHTYQVAFVQSP